MNSILYIYQMDQLKAQDNRTEHGGLDRVQSYLIEHLVLGVPLQAVLSDELQNKVDLLP